MLYLFVPNDTNREPFQRNEPPEPTQVGLVLNDRLEIYRLNPELERYEKFNPQDASDDPEDESVWEEVMYKPL